LLLIDLERIKAIQRLLLLLYKLRSKKMVAFNDFKLTLLVALGGTVLAALFTEVRVIENVLKGKIDILSTITFQGDDPRGTYESQPYLPATSERYVRQHALRLGYDNQNAPVDTCNIWTDDTNVTVPTSMHNELAAFREELKEYNRLVTEFQPISDLRLQLALDESNRDQVCEQVSMDMEAIFPSRQLSRGSSGLMEPLLPPFRQPDYCYGRTREALMDLSYLVHDFGAMCRKLKRTSRTVLIDMGASLDFHAGTTSPAVYLTDLYRKFGFSFDHIYAYEVTPKEPAQVFKKVPKHLMAAYHWINVGVETDPNSLLNPLKMILENFNEDDFIVVKLDIDTSSIEVPLAHQLLNDKALHGLVDQFYFEHHVLMRELTKDWGGSMNGSVRDSIELFISLREAGVAAHSWV
jgi:hypothetical protein